MKQISIRQLTLTGTMAAAVYAASAFLQVPIPTVIGSTRLHMGNVMCLLSGMLLGPVPGGLAAGIGSMLFDLTNPAYLTSAPFTFAFKFFMAWLCGKITSGCPVERKAVWTAGAAAGAAGYVVLYLSKAYLESRFVLGLPPQAALLPLAQKAAAASVNAAVAVVVAVPLGLALRPAVEKVTLPNR